MATINPNDVQIGGTHYKKRKHQPLIMAEEDGLTPMQFSAIKYVTRFKDKGGEIDLDKAIHVIQMMKQFYYPKDSDFSS